MKKNLLKKKNTASDEDEFGAKFGWSLPLTLCPPEEA